MQAATAGLAQDADNKPLKDVKDALDKAIADAKEEQKVQAPANDQIQLAETKKNAGNEEYKKKNF